MNMNNEIFKTKDIYLATTLLALDFPLINIEKNGVISFFVFGVEREPLIAGDNLSPEDVINAYWTDKIEISPKKIFTAFKEIKTRMYS